MDVIAELETLSNTLNELKKNFNDQINAIEGDLKEFHKLLISLSVKYPDHKELLEFIVFINDRIETNQTGFKGVLSESINELISIKQTIIKKQIQLASTPKQNNKILESFKKINIKDIKVIVGLVAFIVVLIGYNISPNNTKEVILHIKDMIK